MTITQKRYLNSGTTNLNGISYRTSDKGYFKANFNMRKILRRGQRLILTILVGQDIFSMSEIHISNPSLVRFQLVYPITALTFELLKKDFGTWDK